MVSIVSDMKIIASCFHGSECHRKELHSGLDYKLLVHDVALNGIF